MPGENATRPVAILGGVRLPFCRMNSEYGDIGTLELMTANLKELTRRFGLENQVLGEVALGTTFYPPTTWNFARDVVLNSGLSAETPAVGVQRACATSLDASILVADKIARGKIEVGVAGGAESISNMALFYRPDFARRMVKTATAKSIKHRLAAWSGFRVRELKPETPPAFEPSTGRSMGEHCEMMAKTWEIGREEQDALAQKSHENGVAAYERGFYEDLVVPFQGVKRDNNLRPNSSLEKLAKLGPSFDRSGTGTLTAGNSSPLTDGAASVLLASEEWAKKNHFPVRAYLTDFESAAVNPKDEGLLMAPAYAMPRMLSRASRQLDEFDYYEIHEAFSAQVLCTLKAWQDENYCRRRLNLDGPFGTVPRDRLNVAGGSVALGHPFGATGARILATLSKLLSEKGEGRGLISICTGGGMGTVAMVER